MNLSINVGPARSGRSWACDDPALVLAELPFFCDPARSGRSWACDDPALVLAEFPFFVTQLCLGAAGLANITKS